MFISGFIEDEIYVEKPKDFILKGNKDKVCLLKNALYGLKQAPEV